MKLLVSIRSQCSRRRSQGGYAILLVLFLATLLLLGTMAVAPNLLTQGKREKEAEMIWRGKQYIRGIKLYYRKTGKFPTSMDDLTKPKFGSIRFMRQAYKDPMNTKDGEWRLIYVGPSGQLIGSLKPPQTLQLSGMGSANGTPAAQMALQSQGTSQGFGQPANSAFAGGPAMNAAGAGPSGMPNAPGQPNAGQTTDAGAISADTNSADAATNEALLNSDTNTTVMGGNIIGVGSKINARSFVVYEKAKNYKQFEFIWDPAKDPLTIGGASGVPIGTPAGQPGIGSTPFGQTPSQSTSPNAPGAPMNPEPTPPETAPPPQ